MANEIRTKTDTPVAITMSLAGLANGVARQSTLFVNTNSRPAAKITLRIKSNANPPADGSLIEVYLIQSDDTVNSDGAGETDAVIVCENAIRLGTIVVTATADKNFYGIFDTANVTQCLGPKAGIIVKNVTGQSFSAIEADHYKTVMFYVPEIQ